MQPEITDKLKKVANNIRARRMELNYSQDYVARSVDISQNTYSKIELAQTLTVERLEKIARVLQTNMLELLNV